MAVSPSGMAGISGGVNGLLEGVKLYYQTQNMIEDQAIKKKLANAQSIEAASKLYDVGGMNATTQGLLSKYGLPTLDSSQSSQGLLPGSSMARNPSASDMGGSDQPQDASAPQGLVSAPSMIGRSGMGAQPQDGSQQSLPTSPSLPGSAPNMQGGIDISKLSSLPRYQRQAYLPAVEAQIKAQSELQTPQGLLSFQKNQSDLKNSQLEQFNKGAESFKAAKDTFSTAADAYGKLNAVTNDPSPKNLQSALMQVIKLDMPRQAVRFSSIAAMEEDPQINEKWGNMISKVKSGVPSDISIKDIKRLGTDLYLANSNEFRSAQSDERDMAKVRGTDASYTNHSYADKMDKLAKMTQKELGPYQAPGVDNVVTQMGPLAQTAYRGMKNLGQRATGLLKSDSPMSAGQIPTPSGDEVNVMKSILSKNPKDPRANQFNLLINQYQGSQKQ